MRPHIAWLGGLLLVASGCAVEAPTVEAPQPPLIGSLALTAGEAPVQKLGGIDGPWGDLIGRFVYDGDPPVQKPIQHPGTDVREPLLDETLVVDLKTRGVANVVVYVRTKEAPIHPDFAKPAKKVEMVARDFRYVPHILPVRLGQEIAFINGDQVAHNANFQPIGAQAFGPLLPATKDASYKPERQDNIPQPVGCSLHPWMRGYILTRSNPYVAVSGKDGSFRIPRLPAQELEFQLWHEQAGYLRAKPTWDRGRFKLTIARGRENPLGDVKLDPSLFPKR